MSRRLGRVRIASAVVACSFIAQGVGVADPLTDPLFHFYGDVTDPIGRAVAGATVSDGAKSTTTGSLGDYRLGERDINKTYRLTASRAGMDASTKDVTVVAPVDMKADFTLQYRTSAALRDTTLSGISGNDTVLDVTTYAPNPGLPGDTGGKSCVTVTDSGLGATTNATFAGYAADGAAKWEWTLNVGTGDKERSGVLTAKVATCDTATVLTRNASASYVIDNTPVTIADIQPKDGSNTAHAASQVVSATIRDLGGSGVDPASIVMDVVDTTTGVSRRLTGLSYNATTGRVTAAPVSLTLGHRHRVEVTAADRSGNSLSFAQRSADENGGAYAMQVTLPGVNVAIPEVSCTLGETNLQTGNKSVTCENVVLDAVPTGQVALTGSGRKGTGFVEATAPITQAKVSYYVGEGPARTKLTQEGTPVYEAGASGYVALRYDVAAASDTQILVTPSGRTVALGRVTSVAPMTATSATFAYAASLTPPASTCSNPVTVSGAVRCVSDPLETAMMVGVKAGESAATVGASHASKHGISVDRAGASIYLAKVPNGVVGALRADAKVQAVGRDLEYDYKVSFATLAKHDVSTTALGVQSLANATDVTGDDLRVYDLTAAAGIIDDGFRRDTVVRQNVLTHDSTVGHVEQAEPQQANTDSGPTDTEFDNATLYSLESTVGTADRTTGSSDPASSGPSAPSSNFQWIRKFDRCYSAFEDSHATITKCARAWWADNDGDGSWEYYGFQGFASPRSKNPWNLREAWLTVGQGSGMSGMQWHDWSPRSAITAEPCKNVTVQVGYQHPKLGFGANLSSTKQWCEKYLPEQGSPGNFTMRWKGNAEAEARALDFFHIIKMPAGRSYAFTYKSGFGWSIW